MTRRLIIVNDDRRCAANRSGLRLGWQTTANGPIEFRYSVPNRYALRRLLDDLRRDRRKYGAFTVDDRTTTE